MLYYIFHIFSNNDHSATLKPATGNFSHAADFEFNCNLYDVTCGDIEDNFDLGAGVEYDCTYFEARNEKLDVCVLSCTDTELVPTVAGKMNEDIVCNQGRFFYYVWNFFLSLRF